MKPSTKISFILAILVLVSFACTPTPTKISDEEIITRSKENMENLQTAAMGMDIAMNAEGMSITITATGVAEYPNKSYVTMEILGREIEVLTLSETEEYIRLPSESTWTPISREDSAQAGPSTDTRQQLNLLDYASNISRQDNETIDGVDCYHLTMDVDIKKALEVANPTAADQVGAGAEPAQLDLWVGVSDLLIRKMTINMDMESEGTAMTMILTITFSDFNQPVTIPQP